MLSILTRWMRQCRIVACAAVISAGTATLHAEDVLSAELLLSQMLENFKDVVRVDSRLETVGTYGFAANNVPEIFMEWRESSSGEFHATRRMLRSGSSVLGGDRTAAFGGDGFFDLRADGIMHVAKQLPADCDLMSTEDFLARPFLFLVQYEKAKTTGYPSLAYLSALGTMNAQQRSLKLLGRTEIDGISCVSGSISGIDVWNGEPVVYRFHCSTDLGFFPIGWDKYDTAGHLLCSYRVREVGSLEKTAHVPFRYPKKAEISYFKGDGQTKTFAYESVVKDIKLYRVHDYAVGSHEGDFTIDPASARTIWDRDAGVEIPVPR